MAQTQTDGVHSSAVWTWDDIDALPRGDKLPGIPAHWPPGVVVDKARWVSWLPRDWGQALLESKEERHITFISPEGLRVDGKKRVETKLNRKLPAPEEEPPEWPEWLPHNWFLTRVSKKLVYIRPEADRYFIRREVVETYLKKLKSGIDFRGGRDVGGQEMKLPPETLQRLLAATVSETPVAKRLKTDTAAAKSSSSSSSQSGSSSESEEGNESTDNEMEQLDATLEGDALKGHKEHVGFSLLQCRDRKAWVVLPEDVLSISLEFFSQRFKSAGWTSLKSSDSRHDISGQTDVWPDLTLYAKGGKLIIRETDEATVLRVARLYFSWLSEDCDK